jgi:hypothetical protein
MTRSTQRRKPIPLWLAAHEAGHVVARVQLTAAWNLSGLDRPGCMQSVRVWIDPDGTPRGGCDWGYADIVPWPYQAISWAAGPIAEARVRDIDPAECVRSSADYDMLKHYSERGFADFGEAMREGTRIVDACWPDIAKLADYLRQHRAAAFDEVSKLLDLPNQTCIYDERTRPDTARTRRGSPVREQAS